MVDGKILKRASEYEVDLERIRAKERAYRRGFQHGVQAAVWALQDGVSRDGLEHWIGQALHEWRFHGNLQEDERPPEPEIV